MRPNFGTLFLHGTTILGSTITYCLITHSFTNTDTDVDAHHLQPLLRKHKGQRQGWLPLAVFPLFFCIVPGTFFVQSIVYIVLTTFFRRVFWSKLKIPRINYSIMDMLLILMRIKFFYEMGMWSSLSHMVANNLLYQANSVGDHDTFVSVENHYEGNDWLKLQIQNSGNFKTDCPYILLSSEASTTRSSITCSRACPTHTTARSLQL